jgi:hypothetical protein
MPKQWNGNGAMDAIRALVWEGIRRATLFYWDRLQSELNVPNTGERRKRVVNTSQGKIGSTYTVYPNPSKPGEPPRKRTGNLQRNVMYELDEASLKSRVGITPNAIYGLFLELGTIYMLARPWLMATLRKYRQQIQAFLVGAADFKGSHEP